MPVDIVDIEVLADPLSYSPWGTSLARNAFPAIALLLTQSHKSGFGEPSKGLHFLKMLSEWFEDEELEDLAGQVIHNGLQPSS